jgi:hypothetical protein
MHNDCFTLTITIYKKKEKSGRAQENEGRKVKKEKEG